MQAKNLGPGRQVVIGGRGRRCAGFTCPVEAKNGSHTPSCTRICASSRKADAR
jgi:hypothetical protein